MSFRQLFSDFEDDDCRWEAVRSRDSKADGFFVYAVRSTRIYSRPTCKARLAQRSNISFFQTGAQAQGAGYRPCKRCRPESGVLMPEEDAVSKIRAFIKKRPMVVKPEGRGTEAILSLSQMAQQTGLSKWHFHRVFKKCVGMTPVEYFRMENDMAKLKSAKNSEDAGLSSENRLLHWP
nr:AraC-type transcriptional regulator [Trichoderma decipiens]